MDNIILMSISRQELEELIKDAVRKVIYEKKVDGITAITSPDRIIDIIDVAEDQKITGYKKSTLYSKACRREIPHIKQGKLLKFSRNDLLSWIESWKIKTNDEIEMMADDYILNSKKI